MDEKERTEKDAPLDTDPCSNSQHQSQRPRHVYFNGPLSPEELKDLEDLKNALVELGLMPPEEKIDE